LGSYIGSAGGKNTEHKIGIGHINICALHSKDQEQGTDIDLFASTVILSHQEGKKDYGEPLNKNEYSARGSVCGQKVDNHPHE
jgi:hypothetical protein